MNVFTATQLWRNRIAEIAKDYKGIRFAVANDESNEDLLKNLGLEESNEEINIGIIADGKRYPMEPMEEFDSDQIREFLDLYKRGKRQLWDLYKRSENMNKVLSLVTLEERLCGSLSMFGR